jgi:hypothetical protein
MRALYDVTVSRVPRLAIVAGSEWFAPLHTKPTYRDRSDG